MEELLAARAVTRSCWPEQLRDAGAVVAASRRHVELEGVLRHLQEHWIIHCVGSAYTIELWNETNMGQKEKPKGKAKGLGKKAGKEDRSQALAGKHLAYVTQHPQLGVSVTFPHEFARLVERRHRLWVELLPLDGDSARAPESKGPASAGAPASVVNATGRHAAIHAALLEAQDALVDLSAFRQFRDALAKAQDSECRQRWHLLRESSTEVAFAVAVGASTQLMRITIGYGPERRGGSLGPSRGRESLWDWLADLARVHLRERFITRIPEGQKTAQAQKTAIDVIEKVPANAASERELFVDFAGWVEPQLAAATAYLAGRQDPP